MFTKLLFFSITSPDRPLSLTAEQQEILAVVESSHNALITGQAGSGKTFLVKEIFKRLKSNGKNVTIVCSSGIATTVYAGLCTSIRFMAFEQQTFHLNGSSLEV